MAQVQPDYISSDCQLAGHHIQQGLDELSGSGPAQAAVPVRRPELAHPITLLRMAYGLE